MSFLNTTTKLRHCSALPDGISQDDAVRRILQDHEFVIDCGPHSIECVRVSPDEEARLVDLALASDAKGQYPLPDSVKGIIRSSASSSTVSSASSLSDSTSLASPRNCTYRVTDIVHTAGLWDSNVISTYEMTDLPGQGVYVRIRSPMSIVMDTTWSVREATDGSGRLELTEDIIIYCSRLLMGTVKGLCEGGWKQIHEKMIARLQENSA